jgi:hypothetical protein
MIELYRFSFDHPRLLLDRCRRAEDGTTVFCAAMIPKAPPFHSNVVLRTLNSQRCDIRFGAAGSRALTRD